MNKQDKEITVTIPVWVVVQVQGAWGSETVKTIPCALAVYSDEESAIRNKEERIKRGEFVVVNNTTAFLEQILTESAGELLECAETLLCNAKHPEEYCSKKDWDDCVRRWRDDLHKRTK